MNANLGIKGVNLGNWLVLEKWMCPSMFEGTHAEDEYHLAKALPFEVYRERIQRHRAEYITEHDFAAIAHMGFNAVRIPVPYFIFGRREPFIECFRELDYAFDWAEKWGIRILIDLHTVPGSQNGFDNGGLSGVCKWAQMPEEVEYILNVLEKLAWRYGKRKGLLGIEALNEPVTTLLTGMCGWEEAGIMKRYPPEEPEMAEGSAPIAVEFLREFYKNAYHRTVKHMDNDKYFVFHDAFCLAAWKDFMQAEKFRNVMLDVHIYISSLERSNCEKSLAGYVQMLRVQVAEQIEEMSRYFPVICGEWCLDNSYARESSDRRQIDIIYQTLARVQLETWEKGAGFFYWNYKLITEKEDLDCWDLKKSIYHGWFPETI